VELLKHAGKEIVNKLHYTILQIRMMEEIHKDWSTSIACPIHRKGDLMDCHNHRGISLLNTGYKVLSNIFFKRISLHAEKVTGGYKCKF
jgi:hypothetical protein